MHRDDPAAPVGPIVEALNEHRRAGRIRAFGGSNWSHQRIREANAYAEARGVTPFAASSPNFSLADQIREPWAGCLSIGGPRNREARDWYAQARMPVFAWSSMAGGFFSGRFTRENCGAMTRGLDKVCADTYGSEENFRRLERAEELGRKKGMTAAQIALAYIFSHRIDLYALVGHCSLDELRMNMAALTIRLTEAEMARLDLQQ